MITLILLTTRLIDECRMIDISIDNIQRLADDGEAWYANPNRRSSAELEEPAGGYEFPIFE